MAKATKQEAPKRASNVVVPEKDLWKLKGETRIGGGGSIINPARQLKSKPKTLLQKIFG